MPDTKIKGFVPFFVSGIFTHIRGFTDFKQTNEEKPLLAQTKQREEVRANERENWQEIERVTEKGEEALQSGTRRKGKRKLEREKERQITR